jgi:uncharacterized protein (DUF4415 family)
MKQKLIRPTSKEDARITAAARADSDAQPIEDSAGLKRVRGRPRSLVTRSMVSLRVDPDVLAALRASGPGWQTRVNALLRDAVAKGRV